MSEWKVIHGDCIEKMREMDAESVDSVVCDPPYGLGFMGEEWDTFNSKEYQEFSEEWRRQALRVLKKGGYLLAFSGTRTYHRMVVGLEDAGFEIKDMLEWMYGSGFPKSYNISKGIDKHLGVKRTEGKRVWKGGEREGGRMGGGHDGGGTSKKVLYDKPATEESEEWDGWGTALKPSHEPIVLAQKPREGTYAENVLEYGVGGLNIDACRIPASEDDAGLNNCHQNRKKIKEYDVDSEDTLNLGLEKVSTEQNTKGRFPSNTVLDGVAGHILDRQSGKREGCKPHKLKSNKEHSGWGSIQRKNGEMFGYDDSGGASRFFYSAKAHKSERNAGLKDLEDVEDPSFSNSKVRMNGTKKTPIKKNDISTLKPINLMRWLTRLVTPEDGVVLDPFAGSGTTGCACLVEGFKPVLIEKRERFANTIILLRLEYWSHPDNWSDLKQHSLVPDADEKQNDDLQRYFQTSDNK